MQAGLLTTFKSPAKSRGYTAWILSVILFVFYILVYFTPIPDSWANAVGLNGKWQMYGVLYTLAMIIGGYFFLRKHGNSKYHKVRTWSVIFFQIVFAFSIPEIMGLFDSKGFNFAKFWPLGIEYLYPQYIFEYPLLIIVYAFVASLIAVPILTLLYGKRWYCSWMCGCGGLAETAGDSFRHLSDKKVKAWKFEQWSIYTVLFLALLTTALVIINWGLHFENEAGQWVTEFTTFDLIASKIQGTYQFIVVAMLSGVLGVGLYPLMGSRVWCRFFCPLAAIMGLVQKFGRFRITVKDDMCISCGNCSTYCEMGIDVRSYAQNNESFKRASCVGCGMCAHVCPRGVLKLENKWDFKQSSDKSKRPVFDL
ncbi:MAG: 4Fe-4S binding protein [Calditrichaeota bacterium]|nr:MAG: 4Fe-4S binding protein [Calditrichota bacterium]